MANNESTKNWATEHHCGTECGALQKEVEATYAGTYERGREAGRSAIVAMRGGELEGGRRNPEAMAMVWEW